MADNKNQVGAQDRSRVAAGQRYEVQHLAERTGITTDEARELIERFGNDRDVLEREAQKLRRH
ncbi:MAG TPA: DUF3606 domain-containing protein [Alphaproteobacteria bacterium]|nr:DUF3606 domain-containing protein [Alphaproteobacteria bacterium]